MRARCKTSPEASTNKTQISVYVGREKETLLVQQKLATFGAHLVVLVPFLRGNVCRHCWSCCGCSGGSATTKPGWHLLCYNRFWLALSRKQRERWVWAPTNKEAEKGMKQKGVFHPWKMVETEWMLWLLEFGNSAWVRIPITIFIFFHLCANHWCHATLTFFFLKKIIVH